MNFLLFKLNIDKNLISYKERLIVLGFQSFCENLSIIFGYKILNDLIDSYCDILCNLINYRASQYPTQCHELLTDNFHKTNFCLNSPYGCLARIIKSEFSPELGIYKCYFNKLKNCLQRRTSLVLI